MFRLKHINNSKKTNVKVCLDREGKPGNYYTVLTGENACGKSSLMAKVVNSFLELENTVRLNDVSNQVAHYSKEVPSRIIAFCNSRFDRFMPESVYNEKRLKDLNYSGGDFYIHTGQGAKGGGGIPEIINSCISVSWRGEETRSDYKPEKITHAFNMFGVETELKCSLKVDDLVLKTIIDISVPEKRSFSSIIYPTVNIMDKALRSNLSNDGFHIAALMKEYLKSYELRSRVIDFVIKYNERKIRDKSLPTMFYSAASRDFDYTFEPDVLDRELIRALFLVGIIKVYSVDIKRQNASRFISVSALSSGQQTLLSNALILSGLATKDCMICIDEPENSLHPQWQLDFMGFISLLCPEELDAHIIVATHSPQIVSGMQFDNGCIVSLKSKDKTHNSKHLVRNNMITDADFEINSIDLHRKQSADKQLMEVFRSPGYKNDFILKKLILILSKQTKKVSLSRIDRHFIKDILILIENDRIPDGDPVILLLEQISGFLNGNVNNDY